MNEVIKEIIELDNYNKYYDGYKIITSEQEILFLIDNRQNCCEDWGYIISEDDTTSFTGAELLNIETTDINRIKKELSNYSHEELNSIFIDVNTSRGTLQFALYNDHDGYYSHDIIIKSKQLSIESNL